MCRLYPCRRARTDKVHALSDFHCSSSTTRSGTPALQSRCPCTARGSTAGTVGGLIPPTTRPAALGRAGGSQGMLRPWERCGPTSRRPWAAGVSSTATTHRTTMSRAPRRSPRPPDRGPPQIRRQDVLNPDLHRGPRSGAGRCGRLLRGRTTYRHAPSAGAPRRRPDTKSEQTRGACGRVPFGSPSCRVRHDAAGGVGDFAVIARPDGSGRRAPGRPRRSAGRYRARRGGRALGGGRRRARSSSCSTIPRPRGAPRCCSPP